MALVLEILKGIVVSVVCSIHSRVARPFHLPSGLACCFHGCLVSLYDSSSTIKNKAQNISRMKGLPIEGTYISHLPVDWLQIYVLEIGGGILRTKETGGGNLRKH